MAQKESQSRTAEKLARFLHAHVINMWIDPLFARLSAKELADKSNFVFIGSRKERTETANEMVVVAERYLASIGNERFEVVGVREEGKTVMGYDGDEVQLLLKPKDDSRESVLVLFAASNRNANYFTHELLPYAQFSERAPLLEEARAADLGFEHSTPATSTRAAQTTGDIRPMLRIMTNVGVVLVETRTNTVYFRNCRYSSSDRQIFVSGKLATCREDVPNIFVSAMNALKSRSEVARQVADNFTRDYDKLGKRAPSSAQTGVDGRKLIQASEGVFSLLENGRVIYTSDKRSFACEYIPGANMLFLDGLRVRRHRDIPREFLSAVLETRELGYAVRNGIADAVMDCIPTHIRKNVGANVISWCLRHKDTTV